MIIEDSNYFSAARSFTWKRLLGVYCIIYHLHLIYYYFLSLRNLLKQKSEELSSGTKLHYLFHIDIYM